MPLNMLRPALRRGFSTSFAPRRMMVNMGGGWKVSPPSGPEGSTATKPHVYRFQRPRGYSLKWAFFGSFVTAANLANVV
jgi:hypothetical protein